MTSIFPAQPGTWLINFDEAVEPVPIIGWDAANSFAFPLLPFNRGGLKAGDAIRLPGDGAVVDPVAKRTFATEEVWRAFVEDETPYEVGNVWANSSSANSTPAKAKPAAKPAADDKLEPAEPGLISWDNKGLQNASWYQFDDGNEFFLFEVPGGEVRPKDANVTKITRKDFFAMRKEHDVKSVVPGDEPEVEVEDEDDDDDAIGGLV